MPQNLANMSADTTRLYFEAHITVDPGATFKATQDKAFADYGTFCLAAEMLGWKCSKFDHDDVDNIEGMWFMSAKSEKWGVIQQDVLNAISIFEATGYVIVRAKIENAVWDTKYGDTYQ